jgi:hypothetical protein
MWILWLLAIIFFFAYWPIGIGIAIVAAILASGGNKS